VAVAACCRAWLAETNDDDDDDGLLRWAPQLPASDFCHRDEEENEVPDVAQVKELVCLYPRGRPGFSIASCAADWRLLVLAAIFGHLRGPGREVRNHCLALCRLAQCRQGWSLLSSSLRLTLSRPRSSPLKVAGGGGGDGGHRES